MQKLVVVVTTLVLGLLTASCATDEAARAAPEPAAETPAPDAEPAAEAKPHLTSPGAEAAAEKSEQPPARFDEIARRYEFICPAPGFTLEEKHEVTVGDARFVVEGTRIARDKAAGGALKIGVVAAPKDKTEDTRQNLEQAQAWFAQAGVDAVLVPGDVAEDEDLTNVMKMLAEVFPEPLLVHSGNIEWTGAFTAAFEAARKEHPNLFNLNWSPHVDFGGVHLLALAGYHNKKFSRTGACRYREDDLQRLAGLAKSLREKGEQVVLSSHGPPLNEGEGGLDFAHEGAGNVGDHDITERFLEGADVRFGVFSHILEAGGRAVSDPRGKTRAARLTKKQKTVSSKPADRLYFNAGSASSFPWTMLDGSRAEGMAALFELEGGKATVTFKRLR